MANTLVTSTWVTKETAAGYVNNLVFAANLTKQYNDSFQVSGAHMGDTINVRLPQRFVATHGQALQLQNIFDQTTPITLNDQINVGFAFSSAQQSTSVDDVRSRYVKPAAMTLANAADVSAYATLFPNVYSSVGTPGTTPSSTLTYLQAGGKLDDLAVNGKRYATLDVAAAFTIANSATTLFNPTGEITKIFKEGLMGSNQLNINEWRKSQSTQTRTTGTFTASTPLVNGATQTGSTININGWASGATTLKRGDKFVVGRAAQRPSSVVTSSSWPVCSASTQSTTPRPGDFSSSSSRPILRMRSESRLPCLSRLRSSPLGSFRR